MLKPSPAFNNNTIDITPEARIFMYYEYVNEFFKS